MLGVMPKKKNLSTLILGSVEPKTGEVKDDLSGMGLDSAAEKVMQALEAKDKGLLVEGMREMCAMLYDEMEMAEGE